MDVEDCVDNVQAATMSMNGDSWDDETGNGLEVDGDDDDSPIELHIT